MNTNYELEECIDDESPEIVNTDALISDYEFQYQIYRMNRQLDIDHLDDTISMKKVNSINKKTHTRKKV